MAKNREQLTAAARLVSAQLADLPLTAGFPTDPDLADFMGSFIEDALTWEDMQDDFVLTLNLKGEVVYDG